MAKNDHFWVFLAIFDRNRVFLLNRTFRYFGSKMVLHLISQNLQVSEQNCQTPRTQKTHYWAILTKERVRKIHLLAQQYEK